MAFRPYMWVRVKGNIFKLKEEYGGRKERLTKDEIAEFNRHQRQKRKRK